MFNQKIIENELSKRSNRKVRFSYDVYYSPDDFTIFRKIFVDGNEVKMQIILDDLQRAEQDGTLEQKYEEMLTKINQYLIIKR
jgi:hypothetical protein